MTLVPSIRRLINFSGATFALVFAWKIILLVFTAQPIPANDAFAYDGPVVNWLLHGQYCNPSLAVAFPFSGTRIFCAYPPLYQAVLLLWMAVWGTSALAAMWLHLVLFGAFLLLLLGIFRRLQTPAWCVNLAGLFLLAITFDDRPDGLAQVWGVAALWCWFRGAGKWPWLASGFVLLALWTNPEIGGLFFGALWLLAIGGKWWHRETFPLAALLTLTLLIPASVLAFKLSWPQLWAGFLEHARQTPSFTNLRCPSLYDALKVFRAVPGVFLVMALLPFDLRRLGLGGPFFLAAAVGSLMCLGLTLGCLFAFTADWINFAKYFQPLVVGCYLAGRFAAGTPAEPRLALLAAFLALALLAAIRMLGMSTWGVACAIDQSYDAALTLVRVELASAPAGSLEVMSSAYLYEASQHPAIRAIHEDWLHRARTGVGDADADTAALRVLQPRGLILTQFDYYRRYLVPLANLKAQPGLVRVTIKNTAGITPPDAWPNWQRVVQHLSWAPVIVDFSWSTPPVRP